MPTFTVDAIGVGRPDYSLPYGVEQVWADTYHTLYLPLFPQIADAWPAGLGASGTTYFLAGSITLATLATADKYHSARMGGKDSVINTWDKEARWRCKIVPSDYDAAEYYVGRGWFDQWISTNEMMGFYIVNGAVKLRVGNDQNFTEQETDKVLEFGSDPILEFRWIPGEYADFYIDDEFVGRVTTNLPSGDMFASSIATAFVKTTEDVQKRLEFSLVEFWMRR